MSHRVPAAIQWHEGMLLAPQHFQQLAMRQEALLHYHALAIAPFHWGVRSLEVDGPRLASDVYRVIAVEAVLPDGLVVAHRAGDGPDLAVELWPVKQAARERPVTVYLAVAAHRPEMSPVRGDHPRYDSVTGDPVLDENTGEGQVDVPRLRPRARLFAGEPPPASYVHLPIARLEHKGGAFSVADYVPPLLTVARDSPLGMRCGEIAEKLRGKAATLLERAGNPSVAARAPQLLETRAMIASLTAALPPFEALLDTGRAHPFALYLALCALVGQVSGLGRALPPALDPYDHDDLNPRFKAAEKFLADLVDGAVLESYTPFPFELDEGTFGLAFDAAWRGRSLVLGVRAPEGAVEQVAAWMDNAVIASRDRQRELRVIRVLGAERRRIKSEGDLLPVPGVLLYALTAEPKNVEANQLLQIANPDEGLAAHRPLEIVLYVKNRS